MPTKDPITVVGLLTTAMLLASGVMLYLTPSATPSVKPPQQTILTSPFKAPPPLPSLTDAELAKLTPAERSRYDKMHQSLQDIAQQRQTLEQENTRLQQSLDQAAAKNRALSIEITKMRDAPDP